MLQVWTSIHVVPSLHWVGVSNPGSGAQVGAVCWKQHTFGVRAVTVEVKVDCTVVDSEMVEVMVIGKVVREISVLIVLAVSCDRIVVV